MNEQNNTNANASTAAGDEIDPNTVKVDVVVKKRARISLKRAGLYAGAGVVVAGAIGAGAFALIRGRGLGGIGRAAEIAVSAVGFLARR